jgi:hypothetical protein
LSRAQQGKRRRDGQGKRRREWEKGRERGWAGAVGEDEQGRGGLVGGRARRLDERAGSGDALGFGVGWAAPRRVGRAAAQAWRGRASRWAGGEEGRAGPRHEDGLMGQSGRAAQEGKRGARWANWGIGLLSLLF